MVGVKAIGKVCSGDGSVVRETEMALSTGCEQNFRQHR